MPRPQLSILQTFDPKASLPPLGDRVWLIERGIVRTLTWNADGHVTTLGLWGQGEIVGLPLTRLHPYQIECLTPVTVTEVALGSKSIEQRLLLNHLWRSQELFSLVQIPCLTDRLLHVLQWLADRFGHQTPDGMLLPPLLTHKQLSEILGSSRVTVTRLLNLLERQGQVARFRKRSGEPPPGERWDTRVEPGNFAAPAPAAIPRLGLAATQDKSAIAQTMLDDLIARDFLRADAAADKTISVPPD